MGRYIGPKHRLCRQYGTRLCDSPRCPVIRRAYRPGQHGPKGPQRISEYGTQLREKQKVKKIYGLFERQFRNYYLKAKSSKGDTGENLMKLLEMRLDNTIYRLKFSKTRSAARQSVNHGHIMVNGKKVTIPSYQVKSGDHISIKPSVAEKVLFKEVKKGIDPKELPSWLSIEDKKDLVAKVTGIPAHDEIQQGFDTSMIIEFYSR